MDTMDQLKERIRYFNREILNPFTLSFAGRPHSPYVIVQHVGRKSGREYHTPVVAMSTDEGFVIPLPYGDHVDWCRNLLAAEGGLIASQGHAYRICDPQVIGTSEGLAAFPMWMQVLLERAETEKFLCVKCCEDTPEEQAVYRHIIADYPADRAIKVVIIAVLLMITVARLLRRLRGQGS
jgi:deazaflavin-dependent oxidoreductase (nitroreductase family)